MTFATILNTILVAMAPVILWLIKHFGQKLTDMLGGYVKAKTNNEYIGNTIKRVDDAAFRIVKSVYMTYVKAIKKAQDRALTKAEREKAKEMALAKLKSYLGRSGIEELATIFNFDGFEAEKYLSDGIEAAVYDAKHGARSGLGNGSLSLAEPLLSLPSK